MAKRSVFRLPTITANTISFVALILIVYEATIYSGKPRIELIGVYAVMLGLPVINKADEVRQRLIQYEREREGATKEKD